MSNAIPNYFKVNRQLLFSDRWLKETFTRGQAWVDLFGLAQHTVGFFRIRGIKIEVKRGQLAYAQETLATRWRWSRGKVKRYLIELESDGDIIHETIHQNKALTTLISLPKYDAWQGRELTDDTPNNTPNDTANGHQTVRQTDTYNKVKKDNKDNNTVESVAKKATTLQELIEPLKLKYDPKTIDAFLNYWTEKSGRKERWQMEKVFEVERRLNTWRAREEKWASEKTQKPQKPIVVGYL